MASAVGSRAAPPTSPSHFPDGRVGTSLQVQPAAGLAGVAADNGARLVIVNADPTPYDDRADELIHEPIGTALPELLDRLNAESRS